MALDHAERMLGARNGWSSAQERIHRVIEIMTGLQTGWDILSETGCKGTFRPSSASKLELERRKRRSDQ